MGGGNVHTVTSKAEWSSLQAAAKNDNQAVGTFDLSWEVCVG